MVDTKEQILLTALRLFARDGYEAVSVSTLAGELGMSKGALYKHYKNKRDIFDQIVARMYRIDAQRAAQYTMPDGTPNDIPEAYAQVSPQELRAFTLAQFAFWTEDEFAKQFRRMLTLEQYRDAEMQELYRRCITEGPAAYTEDIFRAMIQRGTLAGEDPAQLALEFYAPFTFLVTASDFSEDSSTLSALLARHIDSFLSQHTVKGEAK